MSTHRDASALASKTVILLLERIRVANILGKGIICHGFQEGNQSRFFFLREVKLTGISVSITQFIS